MIDFFPIVPATLGGLSLRRLALVIGDQSSAIRLRRSAIRHQPSAAPAAAR